MSAKTSQAVTLGVIAAIAGYFAFVAPSSVPGPVSAGEGTTLDWLTILKMIFGLFGGSAILSKLGFLGPLLPIFQQVIGGLTNTNAVPKPVVTTDNTPNPADVTPSPQQAIDDALLTVVKDALAKPTPAIAAQLNGLLKAIADERFKIDVVAAK